MVCGAPLTYLDSERAIDCSFCGQSLPANAVCASGHFVCDACHTRDELALIEQVCLTTDETDMIALMAKIRRHPSVPGTRPRPPRAGARRDLEHVPQSGRGIERRLDPHRHSAGHADRRRVVRVSRHLRRGDRRGDRVQHHPEGQSAEGGRTSHSSRRSRCGCWSGSPPWKRRVVVSATVGWRSARRRSCPPSTCPFRSAPTRRCCCWQSDRNAECITDRCPLWPGSER